MGLRSLFATYIMRVVVYPAWLQVWMKCVHHLVLMNKKASDFSPECMLRLRVEARSQVLSSFSFWDAVATRLALSSYLKTKSFFFRSSPTTLSHIYNNDDSNLSICYGWLFTRATVWSKLGCLANFHSHITPFWTRNRPMMTLGGEPHDPSFCHKLELFSGYLYAAPYLSCILSCCVIDTLLSLP